MAQIIADKRQVGEMKQTAITAVLTEIKETKEISCQRIQSQVYLNYVECSRNSLSKNSLELFAHIVSENWHETASKDATKKLQESCERSIMREWNFFLEEVYSMNI